MPVVEKFTELELIVKHAERSRRAAAHRDPRETREPRFRTLEIVRRLSLEIRADGDVKR